MLRPAGADDLEPLAHLWYEGWLDGHAGHVPDDVYAHRRPEDFRRRLADRIEASTVAVDGEAILGFVTVVGDEVEQLYVAPAARGTGVASDLLAHGEGEVDGTPWLAVIAGNTRARRFYERHGWSEVGAFVNDTDGASIPCLRYEKVRR